jgi:hypothetical protein
MISLSDHLCCVLLPHSAYCIGLFLVLALFVGYCFGEVMCIGDSYVYWGQLRVLGTAMCTGDSYMYWGQLCVLGTAMCTEDSYVYLGQLRVLGTAICTGDSYVYWGQLCVLGTAMSVKKAFFVCLFVKVMSGRLTGIVLSVIMLRFGTA